MKTMKTVFALGMSALMLTSCGGKSWTKVDFAGFSKAVSEIGELVEPKGVDIKGKMGETSFDFHVDPEKASELSEAEVAVYTMIAGSMVQVMVAAGDQSSLGLEYYTATDGFKVADQSSKLEWEKHGFCVTMFSNADNSPKIDLTASWTFAN